MDNDNLMIKSFADDFMAYNVMENNNYQHETIELQKFVDHFKQWCYYNGLKIFDIDNKLFVLHLSKKNKKFQYKLYDSLISIITDSIRYLGLRMQPDLKWSKHINTISKKAYGRWYYSEP